MTPIQVVGIGLDGASGLTATILEVINQATVLVGSDRHLSYFPDHPAERWLLDSFREVIDAVKQRLKTDLIVILVSGDPLFFGLGRLLLSEISPESLTFHPHLSSVQLAFNRIKTSWQDARIVSAHGRSLDELADALRQGEAKIAAFTDQKNTPSAIARLVISLDLPSHYQLWICENLGGADEQVQCIPLDAIANREFSPLNVVVLLRQSTFQESSLAIEDLPLFGLPDSSFLSFSDRPGLMTKREVRILVLGELALRPGQVIWDVGAGTGAVSIEMARLFPSLHIYAIEKTAAGTSLIEQNCQRFQVNNVISIHGKAPEVLYPLPKPDRIFIGGTGGSLSAILDVGSANLRPNGVVVMAIATLEHLEEALRWIRDRDWKYRLLQVNLARSVPIASLTRWTPLNPVTLLTASRL